MHSRNLFTKILAVTGTILVWFPIFAAILTGTVGTIRAGRILFDYLMPAELFPAAFLGGCALLWAALRERAYRKAIAWSLGAMIALLVGSQVFAVVSGLASGRTEPTGWVFFLVIAMLVCYTLAMAITGITGIALWKKLFRPMGS